MKENNRLTLGADSHRSRRGRRRGVCQTEYHRLTSEQPIQDLRVRSGQQYSAFSFWRQAWSARLGRVARGEASDCPLSQPVQVDP